MMVDTDTPTHRTEYQELTNDTQLAMLEGIRTRRLEAVRVYEELVLLRNIKTEDKLRLKTERLLKKLHRAITAADKALAIGEGIYRDVKGHIMEVSS